MTVGSPFATGITYRDDFKLWWPNYDHNPPKCHGKVIKQMNAMDATIAHCKRRELCIQAGGHAGLWPKRLAGIFTRVITFEPEPDLFAAMEKNVAGIANIEMHRQALGHEAEEVLMNPHPSAGSWSVMPPPAGRVLVEQVTIDSLKVSACDAIFLDIEGYEAQALTGAELTIEKFRPMLHVEILPRARQAIEAKLHALRYRFGGRIHGDEIWFPHGR